MRCLNCHTVLMATDTQCPICKMTTSSGLEEKSRMSLGARLLFALAAFGIGGLLIFVGVNTFFSEYVPSRKVSAAELLKIEDIDDVPRKERWVVYEPKVVKEGGVLMVSGRSEKTKARFMVVSVGKRWMIAMVGPNMSGYRLEGNLEEWDSDLLQEAMGMLRRLHQEEVNRLVPFQIDAQHPRQPYDPQLVGGAMGAAGLFGVIIGISLLMGARK